jgi:hypothetical protein
MQTAADVGGFMRIITFTFAALCLGACHPEAPAAGTPEAKAPAPQTLPNGATLTYLRSNQDGSMPETILVHIVSPTEVHVAKMVERCTDAAYVTAVFDPAAGEATQLVGGRLQKDGTQLRQAWLTLDPATRNIDVRTGDPNSAPMETHPAPPAAWRMYDFDFAEFALFGPREPKDFSFGLALAWPDTAPPLVSILGQVDAKYANSPVGPDGKLASNVYHLESADLPGGGDLFTHASYGYVEMASIQRPNHSGYASFRLILKDAALENGDAVWRDTIAAHWKDC